MEVDNAAGLVFDNLDEGQPSDAAKLADAEPDRLCEATSQRNGRAVPERAGVGIPEDGSVVVEALAAKRLTEDRFADAVPKSTATWKAVFAVACTTRTAAPGAFGRETTRVNRTEARCRKGDEHPWV